ncbi:MAG: RsmF rRNA methyltransferase first C-terminal domain-containing protein [Lachnospiraceae bacterium]|nr:RsmF rRNA methyltransferase first C-terminal domain-containing protein [Lachnospiraceae bacterium]
MTLPSDFTDRMKELLGEEFDAFLASYDKKEIKGLRLNLLKGDKAKFEKAVKNAISGVDFDSVKWCEEGYCYSDSAEDDRDIQKRPGSNPLHEAGAYYIQEPSAMLPVTLLDVKEGMRVLDLCASPGGKSTQIASYLGNTGFLMSNEINPARAKNLSENIERMGVRNAYVTNEDSGKLAKLFPSYFDRVLVDAPCSGEGMFRKNSDAVNEWSIENVKICADRQDEIIRNAYIMLAPGGRMVYSTCTFERDENERTIENFLSEYQDMSLLEQRRIWPHKEAGEGHFVAVLSKEGSEEKNNNMSLYGEEKGASESELKEYRNFEKEFLNKRFEGVFYKSKDMLYLLPFGAPSMKGLKVLRPGLHLGTIKKDRFEPAHAFAMALTKEEVKNSVSFDATDERILKYIAGETVNISGNKGWNLVLCEDYSIGWGKLTGEILKNHYPKGLRRYL